jgi:predicted TIM-barrel fold metal-dependent hydrolase
MRIIDAHHHIWRQVDLPWLLGPMCPRIFGPYEAIKRDYPIEEYLADIAGSGVEKSVYVQTNWAPNWFADEAAWVQRVCDRTGWPHGLVAYADFTVADVRGQLERLKPFPLMRGLRQQFHWHANPLYRFAARPDLPADPLVQRNIARLADYGWSFDLQVFAGQMADAAALARACPAVTFILEHAGMPEDLSKEGRDAWRDGLRRVADEPNVMCKLSAFGTFIHRNDARHIGAILREAVAIFGPGRCLFGSNFPIEKLWTSYRELVAAFRQAAKGLDERARASIFHDTAERVYRL